MEPPPPPPYRGDPFGGFAVPDNITIPTRKKRARRTSISNEPIPTGPQKKNREDDNIGPGVSAENDEKEVLGAFAAPEETAIDHATFLENVKKVEAANKARAKITDKDLTSIGLDPNINVLEQSEPEEAIPKRKVRRVWKPRLDFFASLASSPEMFMEIAKFLSPASMVKLYSISKDFNRTINHHLSSVLTGTATHQARDAARLYPFKFYKELCIPDPTGRPHPSRPNEVRLVPSLRWLQMVLHRHKVVHEILALLARQGHRTPPDMALSLKKMWLIMDVSTSSGRSQLMHGKWMTQKDLWNWQLFIVKLDMRFNDPIDGPGDDGLRKLFLGQRGLTPLWKLLKRTEFRSTLEVVRLLIRYNYSPREQHRHLPLYGIPPEEIGISHLEGWGKGRVHLLRPDELVIYESVRRAMGMKSYIMEMMLWGYVDPITGLNTPATDEEKYISDDEEKPVDPYWNDYEDPDPDGEYIEDPDAVDTGMHASASGDKNEEQDTAMTEMKGPASEDKNEKMDTNMTDS